MKRSLWVGLFFACVVALALRCPRLDQRPMHNDEGVNAIKFGQLWTQGDYKYDPNEHHGPSLYYATLAVAKLGSPPDFIRLSEIKLRLITVAFGVALILLLPLVSDGLGNRACLWAGLFTAVSPAMVFYSRYYIHEMLLVFFTFVAIGAGWRYWRSGRLRWALLSGAGFGLMHGTKETFVIAVVAILLALLAGYLWDRWLDAGAGPAEKRRVKAAHVWAGVGVWLLVAVLLFTSFFSNASGIVDSVQTYLPWLRRAEGASPHIHSWTFYWQRLLFFHRGAGPVWTEAFIVVLAVVGVFAGFAKKGLAGANAGFVRFLAFYTVALAVAYTGIAYKTPWCLLGFWHGMILLAGVGAMALLSLARRRFARMGIRVLLLAGCAHLAWEAWELDVPLAADPRNPYVYAQTAPNALLLVERVEQLAKVSPQGTNMLVKVITPDGDYWPLPWYFRNLKNVGWWDELPADPYSPVMIVSSKLNAKLEEKQTHVMVGYYALRPDSFLELYVELGLWRDYLAKYPPPRDEGK